MTFSFFGIFADPAPGLREQLSQQWSEADVVEIESPIKAVGLRFSERYYEPSDEDVPELINREVERLSISYPGIRFLVLRTECWGGLCGNWGHVIQEGTSKYETGGKEALRRLILEFGTDIGSGEYFEPLRRDFSWRQGSA